METMIYGWQENIKRARGVKNQLLPRRVVRLFLPSFFYIYIFYIRVYDTLYFIFSFTSFFFFIGSLTYQQFITYFESKEKRCLLNILKDELQRSYWRSFFIFKHWKIIGGRRSKCKNRVPKWLKFEVKVSSIGCKSETILEQHCAAFESIKTLFPSSTYIFLWNPINMYIVRKLVACSTTSHLSPFDRVLYFREITKKSL